MTTLSLLRTTHALNLMTQVSSLMMTNSIGIGEINFTSDQDGTDISIKTNNLDVDIKLVICDHDDTPSVKMTINKIRLPFSASVLIGKIQAQEAKEDSSGMALTMNEHLFVFGLIDLWQTKVWQGSAEKGGTN